jgi:hypothetical protein
MLVSKLSQRLIFADTLLEYVSVGGDCESGGIVGLRGHSLGCVEGVEQADNAVASKPSITNKTSASATLSRESFVNPTLSCSLESACFDVCGCD